jgi:broad specificity phosphatase PhoE
VLILVRHGQSGANAAGLLVGRSDPALTELGVRQAVLTGRYLADERSARPDQPLSMVSSPLGRALGTAKLIAGELGWTEPIAVDDRLIELDYGAFDGLRLGDVGRGDWAAWRADPSWRPPGGETLVELQERVEAWCEEVAEQATDGDVVAVTHVSPVKAAASWAIGAGPEASWRMSLPVAAVTRIAPSGPSLHSFGETGHLASLR